MNKQLKYFGGPNGLRVDATIVRKKVLKNIAMWSLIGLGILIIRLVAGDL